MNIHWKYDILFSFQVTYPDALNPGDFTVRPTFNCQKLLKKYNLIFKASENGGMVIAEKSILPDGTKEPAWKINTPTGFTFLLELKNMSLLSMLKPYSPSPTASYPELYGIKRLLYLDNLNDTLGIDKDAVVMGPFMDDLEQVTLKISYANIVDETDWASVVPNVFEYQRTNGINGINIQPLHPSQNAPITFSLSGNKPKVKIALQQGAYLFEQIGSSKPSEIIFSADELLSETPLAVIQIYKDESTNYNQSVRYTIDFEKP